MSAHSRRPSVNPDGIGSLKKAAPKEDSKNMGFLYTGYLDKRNPVTGSYKQRFVVLAHDAIHWFKRLDKDALFGEERGQIALSNIRSTRIQDEDSTVCEIVATSGKKTLFRATTPQQCEEWVSAIRSAVKSANASSTPATRSSMNRRASLSADLKGLFGDKEDDDHDGELNADDGAASRRRRRRRRRRRARSEVRDRFAWRFRQRWKRARRYPRECLQIYLLQQRN